MNEKLQEEKALTAGSEKPQEEVRGGQAADVGKGRARWRLRRPLSLPGKVAAWAFLLGGLASVGGSIFLALQDAASRDLETIAALFLLAALLLVSGVRRVQACGCLVGIYVFYLQSVQPFVIESLTNPKGDPHGGFGHFVGNIFTMSINLLGIVGGLAAVLPVRSGLLPPPRRTPPWFTSALGVLTGLVIGSLAIGALVQPLASAPTLTYTNGVPTIHVGPGNFDLSLVTIAKGSKLLLVDDTSEQHLLANGVWKNNTPVLQREPGAPLVNNLSLEGNSVMIGPFATAGTYHIMCLIHHGMELTIIVQ